MGVTIEFRGVMLYEFNNPVVGKTKLKRILIPNAEAPKEWLRDPDLPEDQWMHPDKSNTHATRHYLRIAYGDKKSSTSPQIYHLPDNTAPIHLGTPGGPAPISESLAGKFPDLKSMVQGRAQLRAAPRLLGREIVLTGEPEFSFENEKKGSPYEVDGQSYNSMGLIAHYKNVSSLFIETLEDPNLEIKESGANEEIHFVFLNFDLENPTWDEIFEPREPGPDDSEDIDFRWLYGLLTPNAPSWPGDTRLKVPVTHDKTVKVSTCFPGTWM